MPADQEIEIETPSTSEVAAAPIDSEGAVETPAEPTEPKTYTSWQDALKDADPEELLKLDAIAGRIGQVADKRARELAAQQKLADDTRRQAEADRAEETRLRNLRSENPVAYGTEMERRDASTDAIREEARRQSAMGADITGELEKYVAANYTKEVYEALANKSYSGTYAQGVTAYIDELNKAERASLRAQWEKDELPALRKKILTELNGGEAPIDASAGGSRAGKNYNSNLEASSALMAGEITIAEYTRQHRAKGWR